MTREIIWTPQALARLEEIFAYIAVDNPTRARTFATELKDKVNTLAWFDLGRIGRRRGTKELVLHRNYIAVYRIKRNEVQIITILHAAQNH